MLHWLEYCSWSFGNRLQIETSFRRRQKLALFHLPIESRVGRIETLLNFFAWHVGIMSFEWVYSVAIHTSRKDWRGIVEVQCLNYIYTWNKNSQININAMMKASNLWHKIHCMCDATRLGPVIHPTHYGGQADNVYIYPTGVHRGRCQVFRWTSFLKTVLANTVTVPPPNI